MPIYKQWKHPEMVGTLTTEATESPENIISTYLDADADPADLTVVEVEMTEAEFDALSEFEGP